MPNQDVLDRVATPDVVQASIVAQQDEAAAAPPAWTYDTWFSQWYRRSADAPV